MHFRGRRLACLLSVLIVIEGASQQPQVLQPGLRILKGLESSQNIEFARIFLDGVEVTSGSPPEATTTNTATTALPVLIAQCTRSATSKFRFELMMNFGNIDDVSYHPPWKSTGRDDLFEPPVQKIPMTFDFFGYTKVKPVKRNWQVLVQPYGEYRYDTPGTGSRNLEEVMFYLRYLRALPTLRITGSARAAQFNTTALLKAMHSEPLCQASGV